MKKRGFTIVELLIVIVVIAILATITVVAYRGITDSAKNTSLLSAMDVYEKALMQYQIKYGSYPSTLLSPGGASVAVCLGEYRADGPFQDNECFLSSYSEGQLLIPITSSNTINTALREFISPLPNASQYSITVHAGDIAETIKDVVIHARGITYISDLNNPNLATLSYVTKGDQNCGRGEKVFETNGNGYTTTRCQITLK